MAILNAIAPESITAPVSGVSADCGLSAAWAFRFAAAATTALFFAGILAPDFVVNSWTHLELSKTIFTDFYRLNTVRNLDTHSPYSQAFPPLWSALLAIVRRVADLGIYTGTLLNYPVCIGLLAALIRLFQRIQLPGWAGAACYLSVLGYAPFQGEALGARTIPLSLTLLTAALVIFFGEPFSKPRIALVGLLTGLACLTRFDALAPAFAIGVAFAARAYWRDRRFVRSAVVAVVYFGILGAVLSPMIAYGMVRFGKLFPSDNTRMVLQADGGGVMDYFKTPPSPDLPRHPGKWVAGLLFNKLPKVAAVSIYVVHPENQSGLLFMFAVVLVIWGASRAPRLPASARRFTVIMLALIPVMMAPSVIAGIMDSRYYSGPVLLLFVVLFVLLVFLIPRAWTPRRVALLLVAVTVPLYPTLVRPLFIYRYVPLSRQVVMAPLSPTPQMQRVTDAVRRDSGTRPHRLILTDSSIATAKYGALTGEAASLTPRIANGTYADFLHDWRITHVYDGPIERARWEESQSNHGDIMANIRNSGVELIPLALPGLYRVRLASERPHP